MGFLELLLIGVGLSMDAFAVAVCQGLCMPKLNLRYAAVIALFFGGKVICLGKDKMGRISFSMKDVPEEA